MYFLLPPPPFISLVLSNSDASGRWPDIREPTFFTLLRIRRETGVPAAVPYIVTVSWEIAQEQCKGLERNAARPDPKNLGNGKRHVHVRASCTLQGKVN